MYKPRKRKRDALWNLTYTEFKPEEEKLRETLCTVGNGYFGTRGSFDGMRADETHYPGTYIAGLYNRIPSTVHGKQIYNSDFVNCPNWLLTEFSIDKGSYVNPLSLEILDYEQCLNLRDAVLDRRLTVKDKKERITRIESQRFASMDNPHYAAMRYTIIPVNYDAAITVRTCLDGNIINNGVARYRNLASKHIEPVAEGKVDDGIFLHVETNQSHVQIVMCAKMRLRCTGAPLEAAEKTKDEKGCIWRQFSFEAQRESAYTLEKIVSIATSRDDNTASAYDAARALMSRVASYRKLFTVHKARWHDIWNKVDVQIEGDPFSQMVTRLHMYHMLCTASPHNEHIDAGMPARGLHGEAYRGHVFWDSIFALPFFYQRIPEIARAMLMYRYRRLDAARNYAREHGYEGAMYPWQTSDDGQEETQIIHYNPVSGKWDPDLSCRQRHVSIAIFYNIWEYYNYTGDAEFIHAYGAEMLIEIARFWASIAELKERDQRYHINGVMGPDEFHEKYPDAKEGGLRDNAYTNVMVVWLLEKAIDTVKHLPKDVKHDLANRLEFQDSEMEKWHDIANRIFVPISDDGIICQYDGYMELTELDWEHYRNKYGNIHRIDRILKSESDSPDKYKASKQADAVMLFYTLSSDEVLRILNQLGYSIQDEDSILKRHYDYYEPRTTHGSTLSKVVHATISRYMDDKQKMWEWFKEAIESDIYDTQGGTTIEGIHTAVMSGTISIITRVFGGLDFLDGEIDIKPLLPDHWTRLSFKLLLRGRRYLFEITPATINVGVDIEGDNPVKVKVQK
jgi:trehalose/maltose hydrolase-like predicted phosphorylase